MLRLFFSFSGRVSRAEYWLAFTVLFAVMAVAFMVLFGSMFVTRQGAPVFLWVLYAVTFLAVVASWMALNVKRTHDLGRPGRLFMGPFSTFDLAFREGEPHDNAYGPRP